LIFRNGWDIESSVFLYDHFIQPCISTFSTFQFYLFHIFYGCFFKGPGEKSFFLRVLFKNILLTAYEIIFQLFNNIWLIVFTFVFLRDLERNFLEGFSQWPFYSTMHINFFNFSFLFVPYILWLFFWGTWRETFLKGSLNDHFIQSCISTFSTFQNYLFHIFYGCFFKGPGEKSF